MMKRPADLDDHAKAFWGRHSKRLQDAGLLNTATQDSFIMLCKTYSILHQLDPMGDERTGIIKWIGTCRIYQQLAKGFGMHSDKPKQATTPDTPDEFGL